MYEFALVCTAGDVRIYSAGGKIGNLYPTLTINDVTGEKFISFYEDETSHTPTAIIDISKIV